MRRKSTGAGNPIPRGRSVDCESGLRPRQTNGDTPGRQLWIDFNECRVDAALGQQPEDHLTVLVIADAGE
jgi:hypothetical protein